MDLRKLLTTTWEFSKNHKMLWLHRGHEIQLTILKNQPLPQSSNINEALRVAKQAFTLDLKMTPFSMMVNIIGSLAIFAVLFVGIILIPLLTKSGDLKLTGLFLSPILLVYIAYFRVLVPIPRAMFLDINASASKSIRKSLTLVWRKRKDLIGPMLLQIIVSFLGWGLTFLFILGFVAIVDSNREYWLNFIIYSIVLVPAMILYGAFNILPTTFWTLVYLELKDK